MPAIQKDSDMMVPVQENEWLFMNDNEEGIDEFTVQYICTMGFCFRMEPT
jgi:hypothetical protein